MTQWWEPKLFTAQEAERIRQYYDASGTDEEINDKYNNGRKYLVTWDHIGDAYEQFEHLADAYHRLREELNR